MKKSKISLILLAAFFLNFMLIQNAYAAIWEYVVNGSTKTNTAKRVETVTGPACLVKPSATNTLKWTGAIGTWGLSARTIFQSQENSNCFLSGTQESGDDYLTDVYDNSTDGGDWAALASNQDISGYREFGHTQDYTMDVKVPVEGFIAQIRIPNGPVIAQGVSNHNTYIGLNRSGRNTQAMIDPSFYNRPLMVFVFSNDKITIDGQTKYWYYSTNYNLSDFKAQAGINGTSYDHHLILDFSDMANFKSAFKTSDTPLKLRTMTVGDQFSQVINGNDCNFSYGLLSKPLCWAATIVWDIVKAASCDVLNRIMSLVI